MAFDAASDQVLVRLDPARVTREQLVRTVELAGYRGRVAAAEPRRSSDETAGARWRAEDVPEPVRSALLRARQEGRPVLVDFSATWCAPCQRFARETLASPEVAGALEGFVVLTVDADAHPEAARALGVRALPSVRLLRPDGMEVTRLERFVSASELLPLLGALERASRRDDHE